MKDLKNGFLYKIGNGFTKVAQKYMPDAFILAVLLAIIVFLAGIIFAKHTPMQMIVHYFNGTWSLLGFGMQLCLMIVLSTVSVSTPAISCLLKRLTSIPKTSTYAIVFGSFLMLILFSINSTFALIFGAIYAKEISKSVKNVHYPLLVAVCYCGYMTWQSGLGGTTPLLMATEGSWASKLLGYTIPLQEMILSPLNLTIFILMVVTVPLLAKWMIPNRSENIIAVDPHLFVDDEIEACVIPEQPTPAQRIEYSRIPTLVFGIFTTVYVIYQFITKGIGALDINMLNVMLLALSLLFVNNAIDFMSRLSQATKNTAGVIIQFPIYAGIMEMMVSSGLGDMISNGLLQIATPRTLPNIIHLSSAILNFLVPSGGGQWAIEAPIYLSVAQDLGVSVKSVVIAASYGDAITDLIQPFWAIPLLSITKLSMRDIMGYCAVICIYGFLLTQSILFLMHGIF